MAKKTRYDLIFFGAFALFGIILWFATPQLIAGKAGFQIDSRLFPRMIALMFIVIGGCSALTTWLSSRRVAAASVQPAVQQADAKEAGEDDEETVPESDRAGTLRVVAMMAIMVIYAFIIKPIGFIPATALSVTAVLLLQGVRKVTSYIAVYVASGVLYCIFRYLLLVQL